MFMQNCSRCIFPSRSNKFGTVRTSIGIYMIKNTFHYKIKNYIFYLRRGKNII